MKFVIKDAFGTEVGEVELPEFSDLVFKAGDRIIIPTANPNVPWRLEIHE